jgi:pyruvate-ferredoxin/flavodoxin oxidoreductase
MSAPANAPATESAAPRFITVDGNEAAANVAHKLSEVIVIYPITPSSNMGELADDYSAHHRRNLFGQVPQVVEMQSEGGAIGAVHGALQAGSLVTSFTASQGLLLMIPNLYKIAGELLPFTLHVAARCVATHALSIFGDHSDVMGIRQCGTALLGSTSVQEAQDMAAVAHAASLESRVPFVHFFDGFRTSHEVAKIVEITDGQLRQLIDPKFIDAHRSRALTPDRPQLRGTAQNPDVFFQAREASNRYYDHCPGVVRQVMRRFEQITGRRYDLFEYTGHPRAEKVMVIMGSGVQTARATAAALQAAGEKVGVLNVRLYRPLSVDHLITSIPSSCKQIVVLDRTKEPGAIGEPMYLDLVAALDRAWAAAHRTPRPTVVGGRYGLASKEFTPAMVKAALDELGRPTPAHGFTVGIVDDVTHRSLKVDETFDIEPKDVVRAVFYGLGSDGTVGANKNSIKIIGEETDLHAQGYFVYDSKKSGAMTVSHLRFGPRPIESPYLIDKADFVAVHHFPFFEKLDVLALARPGGTVLVNAPCAAAEVWDLLPIETQQQIIERKLKLYSIDAYKVAGATGMGRRINTVMQTCFFALAGVLPREQAIACIKKSVEKTYKKKGVEIVQKNWDAIDRTLENLHEVAVPAEVSAKTARAPLVSADATSYAKKVAGVMMAGLGDRLPVSAFEPDGTFPTGTSRFEKRGIALEIPIWEPAVCIQCNKCAMVCPHAAIRPKVYEPAALGEAPGTFKSIDYKAGDFKGLKYSLQVAPEDCTGCNLCVNVCPSKDKTNPRRKAINMEPMKAHRDAERANFEFFLGLPEVDRRKVTRVDAKGAQFFLPLLEYSGACNGCGETPYLKLLTQLVGDRLLIANATGCSSIYGGNLPTTPYTKDRNGRGPAWCNSLFEDNAEFGLGLRLSVDQQKERAQLLLKELKGLLDGELVAGLQSPQAAGEAGVIARREQVAALRQRLAAISDPHAKELDQLADYLVDKSVWLIGGDGWAYDIDFGGLDHVLATGRNVKVLVLDTEVYSNTGGQQSKATPLGAAAKFAAAGKALHKKDLGLMAMSYGHVYVASIAFGSNDNHTVKALQEAESYPGPALIIAYSHCIAHGYDLSQGCEQQKRAVNSGIWPLYRFDPRRAAEGLAPLQLDSKPPSIPVHEYTRNETRFRMVEAMDPKRFKELSHNAQAWAQQRVAIYEQLSKVVSPHEPAPNPAYADDASEPGGAAAVGKTNGNGNGNSSAVTTSAPRLGGKEGGVQ